jgi:hypothetical protein
MQRIYVVPAALFAPAVYLHSAQIVINDICHSADIKTEHVEFIELVNANTSPVDVSE